MHWIAAERELTQDWATLIRLATTDGAGWPTPSPTNAWAANASDLAGSAGELADKLELVPTRRLVVLGDPGAGKTTLLLRLVLDLLARRGDAQPVPILLHLASWNPIRDGFYSWLETSLIFEHPSLGFPATGRSISRARSLLEHRLLLLVLDGFDELPRHARPQAIRKINNALRPGQGMVLASRSEHYRLAITTQDGRDVHIAGAAGIELRPLTPTTIADYLSSAAGSVAAAQRWKPVLDTLADDRSWRAGLALSTPLMAYLARVVYNPQTGARPEPAELLDGRQFPDQRSIESHLFDGYLCVAYRSDPDEPRRDLWPADRVDSWLRFLARHLEHTVKSPDLAWWELVQALHRESRVFGFIGSQTPSRGVTGQVVSRLRAAMGGARPAW